MTSTLPLPRSTRLAMWANAWSAGQASLDEATTAIRAEDPPHRVTEQGTPSEALIVAFRRLFEGRTALAVLPVPGFLLGLAGPGSFNKAALAAGGAVLAGPTGLVPTESGDEVLWEVHAIATAQHAESLREAGFGLRQALTETATALGTADLRAARDSLLDELLAVEAPLELPLPPTFDEADERLVGTALQCLRLTAASLADHAADHSVSAARLRTSTLRTLDQAARRVLVAASAHLPRR